MPSKFLYFVQLLWFLNSALCQLVPKYVKSGQPMKAYENERKCLFCKFSSPYAVNMTWFKNRVPISKSDRGKSFAQWSSPHNATNGRLCFLKIAQSDSGNYTCEASNIMGRGDNHTMTVKVFANYKPRFLPNYPPSRLTLYRGQEYRMECRVDAIPTDVVFSCTNTKTSDIDNHVLMERQKLVFTYALPKHGGIYICKAENRVGSTKTEVIVSVVENPSWKSRPNNVTLKAGQRFKLVASFYGSDLDLKISWLRNNQVVKRDANWVKTGSLVTTIYEVSAARVEDNGLYVVMVNNIRDTLTATAIVAVEMKPEVIITQGREVTVAAGSSLEIICEVRGFPPPTIWWLSSSEVLAKNYVRPGASHVQHNTPFGYLIQSAQGVRTYNCTGRNSFGIDSEIITVKAKSDNVMSGKEKKTQEGKESTNNVIIIISCVTGLIVILVSIGVVCLVSKRRRHFDREPSLTHSSIIYHRKGADTDEGTEDSDQKQLINEPLYMPPYAAPAAPSVETIRKARERMSIKRQTLPTNANNYSNGEKCEPEYAAILPIGQGKLLAYEDMNLDKVCGSGMFGVVVRGTLDEAGAPSREIAVKMLKDDAGLDKRKMMLDELNVLKALSRHPNVVGLVGWCITEDNIYIVEEFIPHGTLLHLLRHERTLLQSHYVNLKTLSATTDKEWLSFAWQVASGMKYLSSMSIIHRDLAARNILLGHENVCKISDFGLARPIYQNSNYKKTTGGELPVRWMAPESIFSGTYSSKSDVWSFGILLWEIVTFGDLPYPDCPVVEALLAFLKEEKRMLRPCHCSEKLYQVMRSCWQQSSSLRPDFAEICNRLGTLLNGRTQHIDPNQYTKMLLELDDNEEDLSLLGEYLTERRISAADSCVL